MSDAPKPSSPARVASSRENGRKGGRPRAQLPPEVVERLGPPPMDPLELASWWARVHAETTWALATGGVDRELAAHLRSAAGTASRLTAPDVVGAVGRLLRDGDKQLKARDSGPELKEEEPSGQHGPARAIRCTTR